MVNKADIEVSAGHTGPGDLRVAAEAQVGIALRQQLRIDRPMGGMANGAAFPHRGVLENERTRLFAVAFPA